MEGEGGWQAKKMKPLTGTEIERERIQLFEIRVGIYDLKNGSKNTWRVKCWDFATNAENFNVKGTNIEKFVYSILNFSLW